MADRNGEEKREGSLEYLSAAFWWRYNVLIVVAAFLFAYATRSSLPLVLAAGLELMYLATVPQMPAFRRLVRSWKYEAERRRDQVKLQQLYMELPQEMQTRFKELDRTVRMIRANYHRLSSTSRMFCQQVEDRLQGLTQSYLRLLNSAHAHRVYLKTTDVETIRREAAQIEEALDREPPKVQEINRKRIEILNKRIDKYEKIRENCGVVDAQAAAIEDVLQLVRDQSVTMRDPQQITDHLDTLMQDVEHTEETVREMEEIFAMGAPADLTGPALAPMPSGSSNSTAAPQRNNRVQS